MRKFIKFCLITAVLLIFLGLIAGIASVTVGGGRELNQMIKNGDLTIDSSDFVIDTLKNGINIGGHESLYELDDVEIFKGDREILEGDIALSEIPSEAIEDLEIYLGGGEFFLKVSPDEKFYVEGKNVESLQAYAEDNTMYLKALRNNIDGQNTVVDFYIPEKKYEEVTINLGAGTVMFENHIEADDFAGEVGAGQMVINSMNCNEMQVKVGAGEFVGEDIFVSGDAEFKVGAGHIQMHGDIGDNLDAKCSMGSLEFDLDSAKEDYNYDLDCSAGNIQIGNKDYSGISMEKEIDNQASKDVKIKCSMGSVTLTFEN